MKAAPKKRRARPRSFTVAQMTRIGKMYPELTIRQQQNIIYAVRAMDALRAGASEMPPQYRWLHSERTTRWGILAELGRMHGDAQLVQDWADMICKMKPLTKIAVQWIRNARRGRESDSPRR